MRIRYLIAAALAATAIAPGLTLLAASSASANVTYYEFNLGTTGACMSMFDTVGAQVQAKQVPQAQCTDFQAINYDATGRGYWEYEGLDGNGHLSGYCMQLGPNNKIVTEICVAGHHNQLWTFSSSPNAPMLGQLKSLYTNNGDLCMDDVRYGLLVYGTACHANTDSQRWQELTS